MVIFHCHVSFWGCTRLKLDVWKLVKQTQIEIQRFQMMIHPRCYNDNVFLLSSLRLGFKQLTFDLQRNHEGKKRLPVDTLSFICLAGKCCKNGINFMYFNNTWMQLHSLTPLHLKNVGSCVCVLVCVEPSFGTYCGTRRFREI